MQVKTRILNPTDSTQSYGWVPKYGIMIEAKSSIVIDGDLYTLVMVNQPGNRKLMESDEKSGRVKVTLLTDEAVEKLGNQKTETVPPPPPAPPIARNSSLKDAPPVNDKNTSGMWGGGMEEKEDDDLDVAYDPFTEQPSELKVVATVNMSDAMWKDSASLENAILAGGKDIPVLTNEDVPKVYTKKELSEMPVIALRKLATSMGLPEVEDLKKGEIIRWILETQGNARI